MSSSKEDKLMEKLRVRMFLADTIDGLQSTAVGKDEKTKTVMMMQAEVKFQDSKSPSEEELVKNLGNPANEKPKKWRGTALWMFYLWEESICWKTGS